MQDAEAISHHASRSGRVSDSSSYRTASLVLTGALLVAVLGLLSGLRFAATANADELYALTFVSDLASGLSPVEWTTTPANGFVPDVLIVALGYFSGLHGAWNFGFAAAANALLVFFGLRFLARSIGAQPRQATIAAVAACVVALFADPASGSLPRLMMTSAMHNGIAPLVLFGAGLIIRGMRDQLGVAGLAALFAIVATGTFSDDIIILQLCLPGLLYVAATGWFERQPRKAIYLSIGLVVAVGLGLAARMAFDALPQFEQGTTAVRPFESPAALATFLTTLPELAGSLGLVRSPLVVLGLAGMVISTIRYAGVDSERARISALLILICSFSLAGPIAAGTYTEIALMRQQLPAYILPLLFVAMWLASRPKGTGLLAGVTALGAAWSIAAQGWPIVWIHPEFLSKERAYASQLSAHDANAMISLYWDAKPTILASGFQFPVCEVGDDLAARDWITNRAWCNRAWNTWHEQRRRLAVDLKDAKDDVIQGHFGTPDSTLVIGGQEFYLFEWSPSRERTFQSLVCQTNHSFPTDSICPVS